MTTADAALSPAGARRAWWVLGAMCLPLLAQSLDVSGIGLLLPSIGADLDAGPTALGWVMNANPLAFGALLLTAGWVADRFGPRALLLTGVGAFGVASALCAVAPSTGFLIAARATQGLASAACFTTSLAVVSATFDERRRPGAIGAWGAVSGAGSAFGPLLAGALAATLGWRWFFVINAPLCLLAVPVIAVLTRPAAATPADPVALPRHGRRDTSTRTGTGMGPTNGLGLAAVAVGFVALSLAVGSSVPPAARLVPALLAAAALAVLWHGRRAGRPVVDPAALAGPWSRAALAVGFSSTWAFGVVLVIGSAMLQQVRGMGPMAAGTTFLAFSGAFALAGAAVGRMVRRAGVGTTMGAGMALTVVGLALLALLPSDVGLGAVLVALVVGGLGQGLAFDGSTTASLAGVPGDSTGEATASVQTLRLLGSVLGVAASAGIVATAAAGASTAEIADLQRLAFALAAVVAVLGCAALAALRPGSHDRTRRVGSLHAVLLPEPDDARLALAAVLGAFRSLELQPVQRDVLRDVAATVYGLDIDAEPIEPLAPEQVMAAGAAIELRQQAVHLMVVLELIADPVPPEQAAAVEHYSHAIGVHSSLLDDARHLAHHHIALMYADLQRSSWYTEVTVEESLHGKVFELARSKFAYSGAVADKAIARKWEGLRDMPAGSWGRGVADFYARHGFPFPGERHGIYEVGARHDFVHVLAEYEATPEGELDVFAFIAACMPDEKGLVLLAVTIGLFQDGAIHHVAGKAVKIARTDTLGDPGAAARWAEALDRGRRCPVDVMGGIDHFALAPMPLDEARVRLGVVPKVLPA